MMKLPKDTFLSMYECSYAIHDFIYGERRDRGRERKIMELALLIMEAKVSICHLQVGEPGEPMI